MTDKLFTKRLRDLTDEAIRESLAEIGIEFEKRFGPAALTASPPVVEREADKTPFSHRDVEDFTLPSERSLRKACDLADMQWTAISMMARNGTIDPGFVRAIYAFARHLDADAILALTPVEGVGLKRFADDVSDVHSRIIIVHQLRASAEIQDLETKKRTGWADTNDRATLMREAADTIERLALSAPVAQGDEVREGIYVASRASIPERGQMWRDLRAVGVQINSSWIDEDGEGETADWSELWTRIEGEVKRSKALVLYAEPSDFPLKGAFVEAGMALAAGIPVFIVAPGVELGSYGCRPIGSWASHPLVTYAETIGDALATLTKGARDAG